MTGLEGWHRPMLVVAGAMAVAAVGSAIGLVVDGRVLLGVPIWLKPFKFAVSIALYGVAWSWLYSLLTRGRRSASAVSNLVVVCLVVEYVVIVAQVVRGRPSHFNVSTPLDATLWAVMGISIVVLWLGTFVLTAQVLRAGVADPGVRAGIRVGAVIALVGLALGFLMTSPNRTQLAGMEAGTAPTAIGAHTVGRPDGGPGMPLTGWSTVGGDLRVAHFVGMHALQSLPLLAMGLALLGARGGRLADPDTRRRVVLVLGAGYAALVALLTWQAERGQPLLHPDGRTLGALAVLIAVLIGALAPFREQRRAGGGPGRALRLIDRSDAGAGVAYPAAAGSRTTGGVGRRTAPATPPPAPTNGRSPRRRGAAGGCASAPGGRAARGRCPE